MADVVTGSSDPSIATVRALAAQVSNWGRWGTDDQIGTLNHIDPEDVVEAARLIRTGERFSLSIPFDENGPQRPGSGRPNPIHPGHLVPKAQTSCASVTNHFIQNGSMLRTPRHPSRHGR